MAVRFSDVIWNWRFQRSVDPLGSIQVSIVKDGGALSEIHPSPALPISSPFGRGNMLQLFGRAQEVPR